MFFLYPLPFLACVGPSGAHIVGDSYVVIISGFRLGGRNAKAFERIDLGFLGKKENRLSEEVAQTAFFQERGCVAVFLFIHVIWTISRRMGVLFGGSPSRVSVGGRWVLGEGGI